MAATDFGKALEKKLDAHRKITCARRGKSSTGLARPDYFDWMSEGAKQVQKHRPDLVVVIIGGNDGQDLIPPKGVRARRVHWKKKAWSDAYRQRVIDFLNLLTEGDRRVLWLELPVMERPHLESKLATIRAVQKDAIASVPAATWVDTRRHFLDGRGRILRSTKVRGYKKAQKLRQDDGIHFSVAGARFFAQRIYPEVLGALGLE